MKNETIVGLNRAKSLVIGTTALALLAVPVILGVTFSPQARAESPTAGKAQATEGKRIRLKYNDTEVREILKAIADTAGVNILVNSTVAGKIDVDLDEMPWRQALAIVLNATDLVKVEKDGIIFIDAKDAAKAQKIVWRPMTMVELTRMRDPRVSGGSPDDKC